jgi:translation initiation factor IF-2
MSDKKSVRLNKLVKEFNVSIDRIYGFLEAKGIKDLNPNTKVAHDVYMDLLGEFDSEKKAKLSADLLAKETELTKAEEIIKQQEASEKAKIEAAKIAELAKQEKLKESLKDENIKEDIPKKEVKDLEKPEIEIPKAEATSKLEEQVEDPKKKDNILRGSAGILRGVKETGQKIDLDQFKKSEKVKKPKRARIVKTKVDPKKFTKSVKKKKEVIEISAEEAQKRVRETLAKLQGIGKKSSVKNRRDKRKAHRDVVVEENQQKEVQNQKIKIAEFATVNELATLMDVSVNEIVKTCMGLGMMVSMNQRLDAETIQMLVEDFGFQVEFVGVDVQESIEEIIDTDEQL